MSLFDWNKDGKKDFYDTYVEYRIHKKMQEKYKKRKEEYDFREEYDRRYKPKNNEWKPTKGDIRAMVIMYLIVIGIFVLIFREDSVPCILFIFAIVFGAVAISEFFN